MAAKRPKSRVLTIFLIKEGLSAGDALQDRDDLTRVPVKHGSRSIGALYVRAPRSAPPGWLSFFADYADLSGLRLRNASTSAVLLTRRGGRLFAVAFGYGRHLLAPGCWEENFGLRTTLNIVEPSRIRSIDKKRFDAIARQTREQASREGKIDDFGLDIEQDLLRALVGTPKDEELGRRVAGMDALAPTVDVELKDLPELLVRYAKAYKRKAYRQSFPWVDHIAEVRDPSVKEQLEDLLVERLQEERPEKCWLAVPLPVDWSRVDGFRYGGSTREEPKPDLHLRDFKETIRTDVKLSAEYLRGRRVSCISAEGDQVIERWTIYQCLYAEVELGGETHLLSGGSWYRVAPNFVTAVNRDIRKIPATSVALPDYDDDSEGDYNRRAARRNRRELALMDGKNIPFGGGPSKIEFCDLYAKSRAMIHVKRYHGSSVMSHLFAQGVVSAQAFVQSSDFRQKVNAKLPASHKLRNTERRPRADTFEVAYAIVSRSAKPLELPFFSKVNLRHSAELLRTLGFKVTLTKIPVSEED